MPTGTSFSLQGLKQIDQRSSQECRGYSRQASCSKAFQLHTADDGATYLIWCLRVRQKYTWQPALL